MRASYGRRPDPAQSFGVEEILMNWTDRLTIDPGVLTGKPVIRGSRLAVDLVIGLLAQDWSEADIIRNYPGIAHADIAACLQYASEVLQSEKVYPVVIDRAT
jgi:uncharacterized protein (DUF433 family)